VGGAIQLTCYLPGGNPLGDPFRYHVRLFRVGAHTLIGAHFEINIPGTADHESLSWNVARDFVTNDLLRAGASVSAVPAARLFSPTDGHFRVVRRPIYDGIYGAPGGAAILGYAGLLPPPAAGKDVPIPADGYAYVLAPGLTHEPAQSDVTTTIPAARYDVTLPKPFCDSGGEYVKLTGSIQFAVRVQTNRSGKYLRTQTINGMLRVAVLSGVNAGKTFDALVSERHRAMITDEYQEVTETGSQTLLSNPPQLLGWVFGVGQRDGYFKQAVCGF
jgi:hypothetical protein